MTLWDIHKGTPQGRQPTVETLSPTCAQLPLLYLYLRSQLLASKRELPSNTFRAALIRSNLRLIDRRGYNLSLALRLAAIKVACSRSNPSYILMLQSNLFLSFLIYDQPCLPSLIVQVQRKSKNYFMGIPNKRKMRKAVDESSIKGIKIEILQHAGEKTRNRYPSLR